MKTFSTSNLPLVTVCMTTYNHERYVAEAINSVFAQRCIFPLRLMIFDDCSTDSTHVEIERAIRGRSESVTYCRNDINIGMMKNAEKAYNACEGDYIAILEGDDRWTASDKMQRQVTLLEQDADVSACAHRARFITPCGRQIRVFPKCSAGNLERRAIYRRNLLSTCSVIYRRQIAPRLPPWLLHCEVGDWPLNIFYAQKGHLHLIDDTLADYRVHPGGSWSILPWSERCSRSVRTLETVRSNIEAIDTVALEGSIRWHYFLAFLANLKEAKPRAAASAFLSSMRRRHAPKQSRS
jgi:glycosyltransferase involved in cell wall biosynthesis